MLVIAHTNMLAAFPSLMIKNEISNYGFKRWPAKGEKKSLQKRLIGFAFGLYDD